MTTTSRLPWRTGPAILDALRQWQGDEPWSLPDEREHSNQVRSAIGARDGALGPPRDGIDEQAEARLVYRQIAALRRLIRDNDDPARARLYETLRGKLLPPHIDSFLYELTRLPDVGPDDVRPHARWLLCHAAHRNPLKFAILLVGFSGDDGDLDDLFTLARHHEFTPYAAVVAAILVPSTIDTWLEMAQHAHGWDKVHLVRCLCQHADTRSDVRAWVLRHGCTNSFLDEYLAYVCAGAGDLAGALAEDEPDDELLDGAGVILAELLSPHETVRDVDSYADITAAMERYLGHLATRCDSLHRLNVVREIRGWLEDEPEDTEERLGRAKRERLLGQCAEILARPNWPGQVREAFAGGEPDRCLAWQLAGTVGVDLWEDGFAHLVDRPLDDWLYATLLETEEEGRARRLFDFAEGHLPLGEIATGPGYLLGLEPGFEPHWCLSAFLHRMRQGRLFSEALVAAALRSPVLSHRTHSAAVLEVNPPGRWGEAVRSALAQTLADEMDDELRAKWRELAARA